MSTRLAPSASGDGKLNADRYGPCEHYDRFAALIGHCPCVYKVGLVPQAAVASARHSLRRAARSASREAVPQLLYAFDNTNIPNNSVVQHGHRGLVCWSVVRRNCRSDTVELNYDRAPIYTGLKGFCRYSSNQNTSAGGLDRWA